MKIKTVWEEKIFVKSYDVDRSGRLKLASLFNYFQETAGNHASHLGVGYHPLRTLGYVWVLSRAKVRVERLPAWGENVTLSTWPKTLDGLLFVRDFRMTGERNEILLAGSTGWLLLDIVNFKPHTAEVLPLVLPREEHNHGLEEPLRKLRPFDGLHTAYERHVMPGDIDVNNHVNNARYVEWIMDCFSPNDVISRFPRTIQVNYVGETILGDVVALSVGKTGPTPETHYIEGVNSTKGGKVVQALIEWG
jgi:medium-chain acyl-[acyl-carrier-protein] hydrolase